MKRITFYDRIHRLYVSYYTDEYGNQVGNCGYGVTRSQAEQDCDYQASLSH